MSPRGTDRPLPASSRRPPVRVTRGGGRSTLRKGRGDDEGGGGPGGGWLVPALLTVFVLLGGSAAWRWWGPHAAARAQAPRVNATAAPASGPTDDAGWATESTRSPLDAPRKGAGTGVRVEILNGSGEPGAAAKLASYLRQGGFNVVQVGSADRYDYLRTLVVARTDDDGPSRDVTRYLGDGDRVKQRARSEADVTVVVGKDRGRSPWGEGKDPNGRGQIRCRSLEWVNSSSSFSPSWCSSAPTRSRRWPRISARGCASSRRPRVN